MNIEQRNATIPKFNATRSARDRIRLSADIAATHLRGIGMACSGDDDSFARRQDSADLSLAAAIVRLASIKATVAEIETSLPALKTAWEA